MATDVMKLGLMEVLASAAKHKYTYVIIVTGCNGQIADSDNDNIPWHNPLLTSHDKYNTLIEKADQTYSESSTLFRVTGTTNVW